MVIGNVLGNSFVKSTVNFIKKNPLMVCGGLGVAGLIGYSAATTSRRKQVEEMNRMLLINPFINPMGWTSHVINPSSNEATVLDGPTIKYLIDRNNEGYQKYYDNLPPQEKIKEYYANGGRGVIFDSAA